MNSLFAYTKKDSILHRIPAWLKLLVLFAVPITVYLSPIEVTYIMIPSFFILALISKIGPARFLKDLGPIIIYSILILSIDVLSWLIFHKNTTVITETSLHLILRLICAVEATSLFFRTTSIYETMQTLRKIESILTFGKSSLAISTMLSLFLSFLPQIFATWSELESAYRARGGRKGLGKVIVLLPMLISLSIRKAQTTYLALLNRS